MQNDKIRNKMIGYKYSKHMTKYNQKTHTKRKRKEKLARTKSKISNTQSYHLSRLTNTGFIATLYKLPSVRDFLPFGKKLKIKIQGKLPPNVFVVAQFNARNYIHKQQKIDIQLDTFQTNASYPRNQRNLCKSLKQKQQNRNN